MGRLIDADLLKECYAGTNALDGKADYMSIRKMIDNQPTAYDVDAVVKQLENEAYNGFDITLSKATAIVKRGGVE